MKSFKELNDKSFSFIIDAIAVLGMGYIGISLLCFMGTIMFDEPRPAKVNPFSKIVYSSELERRINIIPTDEKIKFSCIHCDCCLKAPVKNCIFC